MGVRYEMTISLRRREDMRKVLNQVLGPEVTDKVAGNAHQLLVNDGQNILKEPVPPPPPKE
jgi:hypothetical protein